ncbi:MAG: response regulator transcription factor [Polyangia bacterium]|jgi:DNA-binding NarL/FixJ family response regulator
MTRVLLVDDHAVVRRGVRDILTEALGKVSFGEAGKPSEALEKLQKESWDVVVLDISLPGRGGVEALRDMKRLRPAVPVLVLSMHAEEHYALRALRAGASGYVNKEGAAEELAGAVRKVLMGGTHVSARLAETLAKSLSTGSSRPAHERLSDRELEVMRGLAAGKTVKEISAGLALSEKTVSTYRTRLLEKMQMHSNAELIQYALREGLVD